MLHFLPSSRRCCFCAKRATAINDVLSIFSVFQFSAGRPYNDCLGRTLRTPLTSLCFHGILGGVFTENTGLGLCDRRVSGLGGAFAEQVLSSL